VCASFRDYAIRYGIGSHSVYGVQDVE
jgi:hypothetical protein